MYNQLCKSLGMFTLYGDGRLYSRDGQGGDGHGDKSFRDTVDSLPSGYRIILRIRNHQVSLFPGTKMRTHGQSGYSWVYHKVQTFCRGPS